MQLKLKKAMQSQHQWDNYNSAYQEVGEEERQGSPVARETHFLDSNRYTESDESPLGISGWDNNNREINSSIWTARKEDSESFLSSHNPFGPSQQEPSAQNDDGGLLYDVNKLSIREEENPISSLQMASRMITEPKKPEAAQNDSPVSLKSVASTIPGLAPAFSGSASQYSQSNYSSQQSFSQKTKFVPGSASSAMPAGPPPGFLSPITTSATRPEPSDTNSFDGGSKGTSRRRRQRQKKKQSYHSMNSSVNSVGTVETTESEALKLLMKPHPSESLNITDTSLSMASSKTPLMSGVERPILPQQPPQWDTATVESDDEDEFEPRDKKQDWLMRMNKRLQEIPIGELEPSTTPLSAIMNAWAKTKSSQGASMVEMWLNRAQQEYDAGNEKITPTTKMYTMAGKLLFDQSKAFDSNLVILSHAYLSLNVSFQLMHGPRAEKAEQLPLGLRQFFST